MSLSTRESFFAICLVAAVTPAFAQGAGSEAAGDAGAENEEALQEVVVTGVLIPQAPASVAVSTLSSATIEQMVPISAADLLRNVPGVFVNTALGEIRNVVYSRGISANSTEAASG
jgi:iron complex outermembrane receptor protein